jgi:hypothetical protein
VIAAVALALAPANTSQIWTGRTTLKIGLAPSTEYFLQPAGSAMALIEPPRSTAARISAAIFREHVVSRAAFDPATAAASRPMVSSSLRAIALDTGRDVPVELSAASPADVRAALRAVTAEIEQAHGEILNQQLQLLQSRIDEAKSRIAVIEKSSDRLNERVIYVWNELQDRVQRDTNLKKASESSVLLPETDISILGPRRNETLRSSLLAGLCMLIAMIVLTIVVSPPARTPAD